MTIQLKRLLGVSAFLLTTQAMAAQITFYEREGFRGRSFTTTSKSIDDFRGTGLNDRASSVIVDSGDWQVCEDVRFGGRCALLRPGSYESLSRLRLDDRISSVRRFDTRGRRADFFEPEPLASPSYEYRQRPGERVYEARVTSSRAVLRERERHCWVEREQVDERRDIHGGAVAAGAIIGGIIGHQIGKGGPAITAGGATAGALAGEHVARDRDDRDDRFERDVRHCETSVSGPPEYWDVTYVYNGVEHLVQMDAPPGRTIWVNGRGEPRQ